MDNLNKDQRSKCMSQIKSKWTLQEKKIHNLLKGRKIKHEMHPKIKGSPDIIITKMNKAVFLHGCFWHKCPECYTEPKSNKSYWLPKIERNVRRDQHNKSMLKKDGWKVVSFWEHEVKSDADKALKKLVER